MVNSTGKPLALVYTPLTQLERSEVLNSQSQDVMKQQPDNLTALTFLSYSEKVLVTRGGSSHVLWTALGDRGAFAGPCSELRAWESYGGRYRGCLERIDGNDGETVGKVVDDVVDRVDNVTLRLRIRLLFSPSTSLFTPF